MSRKLLMYNKSEIVYIKNIANSSNFKVGKGDTIDVSESVKSGLSLLSLKGNTLVNILGYNNIFKSDSSTIIEDTAITIYGLNRWNRVEFDASLFKTNTVYTVFFNILENTLDDIFSVANATGDDRVSTKSLVIQSGEKGRIKYAFRTKSSFVNSGFLEAPAFVIQANDTNTEGFIKISDIMVLEGDWSNQDIPYFSGIKSVGEPTLDEKYRIEIVSTNSSNNSHKTQILLNKPLMSTPTNFDEVNEDGAVIRRCGFYRITGEENWAIRQTFENHILYHCSYVSLGTFKDYKNSEKKMKCNVLKCLDGDATDAQFIMCRANGDGFVIGLNKKIAASLSNFKEWLKESNVEVCYEKSSIETGKITPVNIMCYKGGYINIRTNIPPKEVTHKVRIRK